MPYIPERKESHMQYLPAALLIAENAEKTPRTASRKIKKQEQDPPRRTDKVVR
jgi:hypothetical protein